MQTVAARTSLAGDHRAAVVLDKAAVAGAVDRPEAEELV
jgi:hypothetical protein